MKRAPSGGLIYRDEEGACFAPMTLTLHVDGDSREISFEQGHECVRLPLRHWVEEFEGWGRVCYHALRGELSGVEVGPVGRRMAYRFAQRRGDLSNARATKLHRALERCGFRGAEHYELAREATGKSVQSLAVLTVAEATALWRLACDKRPSLGRAD